MFNERGSHNSNLTSVLDGITPVVPLRYLPKNSIDNLNGLWNPWERDTIEYFRLADLWSCYDEWSAYGAGISIKLNNRESVVQYYVPYLSAIQIFTSPKPASYREETDKGDCITRDIFIDTFGKECGKEKMQTWEDCSSKDNRLGSLYFQFFERSTPYQRVPLLNKIKSFTEKNPGLMTLKSIDLSPASWLSVAWYPIYHIPTGRTVKELSTCFLTYHTLSASFLDMGFEEEMGITERKEKKRGAITLPPFGLATHKMQGNLWMSDPTGKDKDRLGSLLSAADSWLKQLRVQQHDFNYFISKRYR